MGSKPSNSFQADRPESGGADHGGEREDRGKLERQKQQFAKSREEMKHAPGAGGAIAGAPKGPAKKKKSR